MAMFLRENGEVGNLAPITPIGLRNIRPNAFLHKPKSLRIGEVIKDEDDLAETDDFAQREIAFGFNMSAEDVPRVVDVFRSIVVNNDKVHIGQISGFL